MVTALLALDGALSDQDHKTINDLLILLGVGAGSIALEDGLKKAK